MLRAVLTILNFCFPWPVKPCPYFTGLFSKFLLFAFALCALCPFRFQLSSFIPQL